MKLEIARREHRVMLPSPPPEQVYTEPRGFNSSRPGPGGRKGRRRGKAASPILRMSDQNIMRQALLWQRGRWVRYEWLLELLYGNRDDGGPLTAHLVLTQYVHRIRREGWPLKTWNGVAVRMADPFDKPDDVSRGRRHFNRRKRRTGAILGATLDTAAMIRPYHPKARK